MTFGSEEMIKAAYESIWNYQTITEKEQVVAREFFYRGALWGASKMEESRQCQLINASVSIMDLFKCEHCGENTINRDDLFCSQCGYKFIKGE
ncbi:hypothetical protein C4588_06110 [Candidatus Parcubacteria bacterium]|nr:MAG: hypothetical protein C4588_06110 [Candidatus Parcubacteria bacterium]